MKPRKPKRKNVKTAALCYQGCCGIFACALASGKRLRTGAEAEEYRRLFLSNVAGCRKPKNWMGGTHEWERAAFLRYLGLEHTDVTPREGKHLTLNQLLRRKDIYQTKAQYIVTVTEHCLYLRTNKSKPKLYCVDQRGVNMRLDSEKLKRDLRKRVMSVWRVDGGVESTKSDASAESTMSSSDTELENHARVLQAVVRRCLNSFL